MGRRQGKRERKQRGSWWSLTLGTYLGPGGHQPLQLARLVAPLEQAGTLRPGLGLCTADSLRQQLGSVCGVGALAGHSPPPPALPACPGTLHIRMRVASTGGPGPALPQLQSTEGDPAAIPSDHLHSYLCPGSGAPCRRTALGVAGLPSGRHGLWTEGSPDRLCALVGTLGALHKPALGAPSTCTAAGAPVSHGPAGRGQRELGEG